MEIQEVKHYQIGTRYRVKYERAASANKTDGFVVEANGDDLRAVQNDADLLYLLARTEVTLHLPNLVVKVEPKKEA